MEKKSIVADPWTGQGDCREFPNDLDELYKHVYLNTSITDRKLLKILREIVDEFLRATKSYGTFANAHEGYAVLLEEVDELWDEIKKRPGIRNDDRLRHEATQVAAMAVRFIYDTIREDK